MSFPCVVWDFGKDLLSYFSMMSERNGIPFLFFFFIIYLFACSRSGFPDSSVNKESSCDAEDLGLIPGFGESPGEGNGNPLQYFLPGKSPWTEEPGRLQSVGSQTRLKPPPHVQGLLGSMLDLRSSSQHVGSF